MDNKAYSKRELDLVIKNVVEKNDAWSATILNAIESGHKAHEASLNDMREHEIQPILAQTTKTNGRVSSLENTRMWVRGILWPVALLVPIMLTVMGWVILQLLNQDAKIQAAIDQRFQIYQIKPE